PAIEKLFTHINSYIVQGGFASSFTFVVAAPPEGYTEPQKTAHLTSLRVARLPLLISGYEGRL
ncbi:MAG: hypothetical protein KIH10_17485, partial [Candidatus Freyarchaeota archaeon]|nr:hypothetical protein [Candidatus Jordarchaeia archaeon]